MWGIIQKRLVDDWRDAKKWWSVRMNAIGIILYPFLIAVPQLPDEVQELLPLKVRLVIAGAYSLLALLARIYMQKPKDDC